MWFTTTIVMEILGALDAFLGVQGRSIQLFLDSFAACLQAMSFLRNVKVVCSSSNCRSVLQPLNFGIIPCCNPLYNEHILQKAVCLMDSGKDIHEKSLKSALFWDIMRCHVVIVYHRFRTTYQFHLQGSEVQEDFRSLRMGPICCPKSW
jgi:hypothetical protein